MLLKGVNTVYEIGKNIKTVRELRGISQKDFAKMINSKNTTVSNWEKGLTRPDVDTLAIICKTLEVSADDLLDISVDDFDCITKPEQSLLANYNKLNDIGQHEASKRVEELTYIDKYKKEKEHLILKAAHEIEGASEEDKQHDYDIMDDDNF